MAGLRKLFKVANNVRLSTLLLALWKLVRHAQTPRPAKLLAVAVLAYALSPIDLVPDVVPLLGLLDELVLVPLGLSLVVRLTPQALWQARVAEAESLAARMPRLLWGVGFVLLAWLLLVGTLAWWWWSNKGGA